MQTAKEIVASTIEEIGIEALLVHTIKYLTAELIESETEHLSNLKEDLEYALGRYTDTKLRNRK